MLRACVIFLGLLSPAAGATVGPVRGSRLLTARPRYAARMSDDPHPWSASAAMGDLPPDAEDSAGQIVALPEEVRPNTKRTPREVIMIVLNALRTPDEPYENYGPQVAIAYSAPSNGASQLTPGQFAGYLSEDSYQIFAEWDDVEMEDELEIEDDGEHAYQDVMVKRKDDASWTHINWNLIKHEGMWMSESVVTY
mmetsp:Transcript_20621/g.55644  ORF Transcript_20621/g.55644 Transcript_20621/m.55644 type:complete len:195 (-) Transcript_20621:257-841(-)